MTDNFPQYDTDRPADQVIEPAPDPWSGEEIRVKTVPKYTGPVLTLGDETFKAVRSLNKWALIKLAVAEKRKDEEAQAIAVHDLAMSSIHPDDRERFDDYMLEHGTDDETFVKMQEGVGELVAYWTGRKSEPSPDSSPALATEETPPLSRHVSFSEGKVTVLPARNQETSTAGPESLVG